MMLRNLVTPVLALGLTGAAIYYAPCLSGDCGQASVAAADDEASPCAGENEAAHGALAAGEAEEPCPYASGDEPCDGKKNGGDTDPRALAAAGEDEEPCPYATGDEPCHGNKQKGADGSTLAAAEASPTAAAEPTAPDGSRS